MLENNTSDLTLLLPIKDRISYFKRYISYLINYQCNFKIIIADGSKEADSEFYVEIAKK